MTQKRAVTARFLCVIPGKPCTYRGILNPLLLNNEYCTPFLRVSPATVPPERAPTVAGGHLRHSGTSASDAPPPRRRNVMPLAMRPLREQTAHCRRTPVLPSALTRSPPVAAPTPNKFPSGIGEFLFVTLTGLQGFSRLTHSAERRYFDEVRESPLIQDSQHTFRT